MGVQPPYMHPNEPARPDGVPRPISTTIDEEVGIDTETAEERRERESLGLG